MLIKPGFGRNRRIESSGSSLITCDANYAFGAWSNILTLTAPCSELRLRGPAASYLSVFNIGVGATAPGSGIIDNLPFDKTSRIQYRVPYYLPAGSKIWVQGGASQASGTVQLSVCLTALDAVNDDPVFGLFQMLGFTPWAFTSLPAANTWTLIGAPSSPDFVIRKVAFLAYDTNTTTGYTVGVQFGYGPSTSSVTPIDSDILIANGTSDTIQQLYEYETLIPAGNNLYMQSTTTTTYAAAAVSG